MENSSAFINLEERADYLRFEDLEMFSVVDPFFKKIRDALFERGIKLIEGPRGTGKTHQMRLAFNESLRDKTLPLAIYATFNQYYRLEPILHKAIDAKQIFHTWVLVRIILATVETQKLLNLMELDLLSDFSPTSIDELGDFASLVEKGIVPDEKDEILEIVTIKKTISLLEILMEKTKRQRIVLLLDDAALTLTPDYMIEFFDIVRSLKTSRISPKASVYPGTTNYGPRFHVRHDAQVISSWLDVTSDSYSNIMQKIFENRISGNSTINQDVVDLFKYASFGVPRVFLSMLRSYEEDKSNSISKKINIILENQAHLMYKEFESIKYKLPQFKSLIDVGKNLQEKIVSEMVLENKKIVEQNTKISENSVNIEQKNIIIGILIDDAFESKLIQRLLNFLQEVGMLFPISAVSHGEG
jgi:hypothetical protein